MMILVTYDVDMTSASGAKRLRRVAKYCENYGIRVQNSVFELLADQTQYEIIKLGISKLIDAEKDSVRFYKLGNAWENKIETLGIVPKINQGGTLIL